MIEIAQEILGITLGETSYDDIIMILAVIIGMTAILVVIQVFKSILNRR